MKRIVVIAFIASLILVTIPVLTPEPVSAMTGSGTVGDPYVIYNVTDLQDMSSDPTAYYVLNNSINASVTETWNGGAGFIPISGFSGNLNGNNYTISGLYEDRTGAGYGGLFSTITGGTVQYLVLTSANITVYDSGTDCATFTAVLAGKMTSGLVQYVVTHGVVDGTSNDSYGGNGHSHAGAAGIIGWVVSGTLRVSAAYVDVTATGMQEALAMAGGCVAKLTGGAIRDCYARGNVAAWKAAGYSVAYSGGGLGYHSTGGTMDNCYSTGIPTGDTRGGLLGKIDGGASSCTDSFWDTQTSGIVTSDCGTGKTTAQMKTQATFTDAGWDFDTIWAVGGAINDGYPYLLWWYDPLEYPGNFTQVQWFQPNTIIEGTTLPDRMSNEDGVINWGTNPAGIDIALVDTSGNYSAGNYTAPGADTYDMLGPTGNPGWTGDFSTHSDHPLYFIVNLGAQGMNIPIQLMWPILAWLAVTIVMGICYFKAPHQLITAMAGGGLVAYFYSAGIFQFWDLFIFAAMAIAVLVKEMTPSIS